MSKDATFKWPDGKSAAVSLTFDDARRSQPRCGIPLLDELGVRATFYVSVAGADQQLEEWERAVETGHEIGNHSLNHPCSGNFPFSRHKALEDYSLNQMEDELLSANDAIKQRLGVCPITFAYPCGQKFVGRGEDVQSYVPLVARHFLVGRSAFDETHNDPGFVDLAQATALDADGATFDRLKSLVDAAHAARGWLILLGHEVGEGGRQTVRADVLRAFCEYLHESLPDVWIDTVATIGQHVAPEQRRLEIG